MNRFLQIHVQYLFIKLLEKNSRYKREDKDESHWLAEANIFWGLNTPKTNF